MLSRNIYGYKAALLASCSLLGSGPALAQVSGEPQGASAQTEVASSSRAAESETDASDPGAIIVTGTRLVRINVKGTSPITVVSGEEIKREGSTRIEDVLNRLPQVFAQQGGFISGGATGAATVNLRNLSPSRTLVLVNGRRLMPGDPNEPTADLNSIPAALVERVDVLTGGASSVYGADAVAGVVNFVLKSNFQGVRLDAQYGLFSHDNASDPRVNNALNAAKIAYPSGNSVMGGQFDGNLSIGTKFAGGRGHVAAYAGYRRIQAVRQGQIDYSTCGLAASTTDQTFRCTGAFFNAPSVVDAFTPNFDFIQEYLISADGRSVRPRGTEFFNTNPPTYFQRPDERYTAGGFAHFEISRAFVPYLEVNYMADKTVSQTAPTNIFANVVVPCSSRLFSPEEATAFCPNGQTTANLFFFRKGVENGNRRNDQRHYGLRAVLGLRGDIGSRWHYDVYGQYGRTAFHQYYYNDISAVRLANAIDVVASASAPGGLACRSGPPCAPYNPFRGVGIVATPDLGVTQAAVDYLSASGRARGVSRERIVSGSIAGDLGSFKSPLAADPIGLAVGAEYRDEKLVFTSDDAFKSGELVGYGTNVDLSGTYNVRELFTELKAPLVQDKPFFQQLAVEGGYRFSRYHIQGSVSSHSYSTHTYKVGAEWAPVAGLRFRGSYNRAVRSANPVELFTPQFPNTTSGADPCAGPVPAFSLQECQRTGVTSAQYGHIAANPDFLLNTFTGGNPDLRPERADTWTGGVVVTPHGFLRGFTASVDYFDINIQNQIGGVGAEQALQQCGKTGDPRFCNLIRRHVGTGSLWFPGPVGTPETGGTGFILNTNVNVGNLRTQGVDVAADYRTSLSGVGLHSSSLTWSFVGSYFRKFAFDRGVPAVQNGQTFTSYDCAGHFGGNCGINPKWRHNLRMTYSHGRLWDLSVLWRYIGSTTAETSSSNPFLSGTVYPANRRIPAQSYFDLSASVNFDNHLTLRAGVNNVFDVNPPIVGRQSVPFIFGTGNTFPQVYDPLGRFLFVGASVTF